MTNNDRSLLEPQTAQNTQLTPARELLTKAEALHRDISQGTGVNIAERTAELLLAFGQHSVENQKYMARMDQRFDAIEQDIANAKRKALEGQAPPENTSFQRLVNDWCNAVGASTSLAWRRLLNLAGGAI
jgi:hypothetical protein